jgi:two-component system, LytTR family, response regulator LytT
MRVVIVEDNKTLLIELKIMLREIDPSIEVVQTLSSVKESIKWFSENKFVDLVFMDIKLSDGMCFEIFSEVDLQAPIIFTTSLGEYSLKAFESNSVDYLLKPVSSEKLVKSLQKFRNIKSSFIQKEILSSLSDSIKYLALNDRDFKTRFLVYKGDSMFAVETKDIALFHLVDGTVFLVTGKGDRFILNMALDEIEKEMDPRQFHRANRQVIVSAMYIRRATNYFNYKLLVEMTIKFSDQILVSRERASEFKRWLDGYFHK